MSRFELGLSIDYCADWKVYEAVREFVQNAYDEEIVNPKNKMYWEYDKNSQSLFISNKNGVMKTRSLLLGSTSKRDNPETIGRHGEGYKVATAVLMRLGKGVKIYNRLSGEVWTARVVHSRRYQADVVVFDVSKELFKARKNCDLTIELSGISEEEFADIRDKIIILSELKNGEDYMTVGKSKILLNEKYKGMVFVGGLYVQTNESLMHGFDFEPSMVELDRDRSIVDSFNLQFLCAKVISHCPDIDFISEVKDTFEGEYIRCYLSNNTTLDSERLADLFDMEYKAFTDKYGENAIPVDNEDDFNRLSYLGKKPIMVSRNKMYYISSSSGYSSPDLSDEDESLLSEKLADELEEWFNAGYEDVDSMLSSGEDIVNRVVEYLREAK